MSFKIDIDGKDRDNQLRSETVDIRDGLNETKTSNFVMKSEDGSFRPKIGQEVIIDDEDNNQVFAGSIDTISETNPVEERYVEYDISASDNNYLASRRTYSKTFQNTSAGSIVKDVVDTVLTDEGVTKGKIETGANLEKFSARYEKVDRVLDRLAGRSDLMWTIRDDKTLDFTDFDSNPAPWKLNESNLDRVQNLSTEREDDRKDYVNRKIVRGMDEGPADPITEEIVIDEDQADGIFQEFRTVAEGLLTTYRIDELISFKKNGKSYPAEEKICLSCPTGPSDFFITALPGSRTLLLKRKDFNGRWNHRDFYEEGDVVKVRYVPRAKNAVAVDAPDAQSDRQKVEGGSGLYESVEKRESRDTGELKEYAKNDLKRRNSIGRTIRYDTYRKDLEKGMTQIVDLPNLHIDEEKFYIIEKRLNDQGRADGRLRRSFVLSSEKPNILAENYQERSQGIGDPGSRNNEVVYNSPTIDDSDFGKSDADFATDVGDLEITSAPKASSVWWVTNQEEGNKEQIFFQTDLQANVKKQITINLDGINSIDWDVKNDLLLMADGGNVKIADVANTVDGDKISAIEAYNAESKFGVSYVEKNDEIVTSERGEYFFYDRDTGNQKRTVDIESGGPNQIAYGNGFIWNFDDDKFNDWTLVKCDLEGNVKAGWDGGQDINFFNSCGGSEINGNANRQHISFSGEQGFCTESVKVDGDKKLALSKIISCDLQSDHETFARYPISKVDGVDFTTDEIEDIAVVH